MLDDAVIRGDVVQGRRRPLHATLVERLKKARLAASMERKALSLRAGLADSTIWSLEAEGRVPGLDTIEKIAMALNVSPCYLAYGVEGDPPPPVQGGVLRATSCGSRLVQLREHRGFSLRGLGDEAQVSGAAIQTIESGRVVPSVATAEQLAQALDCSPCWLAFGEGTDPLQEPARAAAEAAAVKYRPPRKLVAPRRRRASRKAPASPRGPR